jgi:wyosine [tRNA(Phe)-imidazoG37] synthetase (radical SAM superfamily)
MKLNYIYGPVPSWRVGSSLGIDLLSQKEKICSYDCLYCQLGRTGTPSMVRQLYVPEDVILKELDMLPETSIDYITFSGRGEPTLAKNLGYAINAVKAARREKIAVITNSSLMDRQEIREELSQADLVIAKLDASSQESFIKVNHPCQGIEFNAVVEGMKEFKKDFRGKLTLQIMFMEENLIYAEDIVRIANEILPDEVHINTPLRPCAVDPLSKEEISEIKELFNGLNAISVYESQKKYTKPISDTDTMKRRGKT